MILKDIIEFIEEKIPQNLALDFDSVGFCGNYDLNQEIDSIKIFMDLMPEDDIFTQNTLVITHHPPLFKPVSPTYTIHSNWDIIDGGANEALAETLNLNVKDYFDDSTNIGRICEFADTFGNLKKRILDSFDDARAVNVKGDGEPVNLVGIVSGFGLKNPDYIELAKSKNLDVLISGDLTQETAVLSRNLKMCVIDLGHHESEVPGLYKLKDTLADIGVEIEVVDRKPIEKLTG